MLIAVEGFDTPERHALVSELLTCLGALGYVVVVCHGEQRRSLADLELEIGRASCRERV